LENLKEGDHLNDMGVGEKIMVRCVVRNVMREIGWILRTGTSGRLV
jgi:hypothetical protein